MTIQILDEIIHGIRPNPTMRYDLAQALQSFDDVAVRFAANRLAALLLVGVDDLDNSDIDLMLAANTVLWEAAKAAQLKAFPGPIYTDDQTAELLAGIRG